MHATGLPPRILLWMLLLPGALPGAQPATAPVGPQRWAATIEAFEREDRQSPPPAGAILFIGSSSIVGWKLTQYFPDLTTINRGFGGSQIADSLFYADRIVIPYRPAMIVFYAGENDIVAGKSPPEVADDFKSFVSRVCAALPETKILFISLKPSRSRWRFMDQFRRTNELIQHYCESRKNLEFIDVEPLMLNAQGLPREELFRDDALHLSPQGYALWSELIRPYLETTLKPATAPATGPSISAEASALLNRVREAYAALGALELAGTYRMEIDVAGQRQDIQAEFTASFLAPNRFRHAMQDDALVVSDGKKAALYVERVHRYLETAAPMARCALRELPESMSQVLRVQNPSLRAAICTDAAAALVEGADSVTLVDPQRLGNLLYEVLQLQSGQQQVHVLIDPATHLLRRVRWDMAADLASRGLPDVKQAVLTVDYTRVDPEVAIDQRTFTWKPPASASAARETGSAVSGPDAESLRGKPAPDSPLKDTND